MTDFDRLDAVYPLPLDELPRQWVLGQEAGELPPEWERRELNGWTLAAHPLAYLARLETRDGRHIGWVLEAMLHTDADGARVPGEAVRIDIGDGELSEAKLEKALYGRDEMGWTDGTGLEGYWIAIVLVGSLQRVYLSANNSTMYDAAKRRVATSHNLLQPFERDLELSRAFDPLETLGYYSFGLTAFKGVKRLLPNHYLDLTTFEPVRHWPKTAPRREEGGAVAGRIIEHGQRVTAAIAAHEDKAEIPLSAGNDSRAVLASARKLIEQGDTKFRAFTSVGKDFDTRIDVQGATKVARIAGVEHEIRQRARHEKAPLEKVMRLFARIGEAKSGPSLSTPRLLASLDDPDAVPEQNLSLAGMGGEVGRASYYGSGVEENVQPEELLRRLGAPVIPRTVEAARRWLDGIPGFFRRDPHNVLDLAAVEQRLGCWEANSRYVWPGRPKVFSFMLSAVFIEGVFQTPVDYRRSGRIQRDMIAHGWPELLAVPINGATGMLALEHRARVFLKPVKDRVFAALGR